MKRILFGLLSFIASLPLYAQMQAVDLGLSVDWGTCNLGASQPQESGDFYAWGETKPKTSFREENYKLYRPGPGQQSSNPWDLDWEFVKYCTDTPYGPRKIPYGTVDNKLVLEAVDDAATATLGNKWRMPTAAERNELLQQCRWEWTKVGGVYGYEITSKKNGNSIFLPVTGYYYQEYRMRKTDLGYYWTSSLDKEYPYGAQALSFSSDILYPNPNSPYELSWWARRFFFGFAIRPVKIK